MLKQNIDMIIFSQETCLLMKIAPLIGCENGDPHCALTVLQKHLGEVMAKFRKFQRPVDFEPKLTHVKRVLDEIDERIHLIELCSEDPDVVQGQLDHCMVSGVNQTRRSTLFAVTRTNYSIPVC